MAAVARCSVSHLPRSVRLSALVAGAAATARLAARHQRTRVRARRCSTSTACSVTARSARAVGPGSDEPRWHAERTDADLDSAIRDGLPNTRDARFRHAHRRAGPRGARRAAARIRAARHPADDDRHGAGDTRHARTAASSAAEPGNWLMYGGDYGQTRFSALRRSTARTCRTSCPSGASRPAWPTD